MFASVLLQRLKSAGAEARVMETQYGFKSGAETRDAIFIVRRMLDQCALGRDNPLIFLALDWAKAFDSISVEGLLTALRRFGLSHHIVQMVAEIYRDRKFVVADSGHISQEYAQSSGISQGCPLSPFLFNILMSILIHDAKLKLQADLEVSAFETLKVHDILYADDTLLIAQSKAVIESYMQCIGECGK